MSSTVPRWRRLRRLTPADLFVRRVLLPIVFFVGICGLAHYVVTGNHAVVKPGAFMEPPGLDR